MRMSTRLIGVCPWEWFDGALRLPVAYDKRLRDPTRYGGLRLDYAQSWHVAPWADHCGPFFAIVASRINPDIPSRPGWAPRAIRRYGALVSMGSAVLYCGPDPDRRYRVRTFRSRHSLPRNPAPFAIGPEGCTYFPCANCCRTLACATGKALSAPAGWRIYQWNASAPPSGAYLPYC